MDIDDHLPPPRARPPSTTDLAKVRSLVDPSSMKPLEGRRIMVPLTTKAFFEGTLRPTSRQPSSSSVFAAGEGAASTGRERKSVDEEMLLVNLEQGYLAEMTRGKAADLIGRRIETISGVAARTKKSEKSREKKGKAEPEKGKNASNDVGEKCGTQVQQTVLPFYEIREEFDEHGNEISANAYNMAEELKLVQKELKAKRAGGGDETKEIKDTISEMKIDADDDAVGRESQDRPSQMQKVDQQPAEVITDEKFEALSARLDELARLEEEDEHKKQISARSSKRLQGKAWAKGFLSDNSTKNKTMPESRLKSTPQHLQKDVLTETGAEIDEVKRRAESGEKKAQSKGWKKGFLNNDRNAKKKSRDVSNLRVTSEGGREPQPASGVSSEHKKKVAFGADEVREIPRIGQTSFKEVGKARQSGDTSRGTPKPFENDAFSGVVKERSAAERTQVVVGQLAERSQNGETHSNASADNTPKKKLSRFAQQRQQLRL